MEESLLRTSGGSLWEKVYLRSQILERPSIGEYLNNSGVPVLPENVIFTFFRTCRILERKNGLVLSNTRVPVSGTWSMLFPVRWCIVVETFKNNYKKLFIPSFMQFIPAEYSSYQIWVFWYQLTEGHVQVCFEEFEEN